MSDSNFFGGQYDDYVTSDISHQVYFVCQGGHEETIENLSDEMREDYLLSVKKAIGEGEDLR